MVEKLTATVAAPPIAGLAAMLDADPASADTGRPLPVLWQWVALSAWPFGSALGPDGHPAPGGFMPPTPYPRRMWLGASVDVTKAPVIGSEVVIERTVSEVLEKTGSTGRFAIVTVSTGITTAAGDPLLIEHARFGYRSPSGATRPTPGRPVAHGAINPWFAKVDGGWRFSPDPVMLMRYSALTANGHRIHYDVPYVTEVEGYPNLLVHGPLMATMLAEAVRRDLPDREVARFECRARQPFFLGRSATVRSTQDGNTVNLQLQEDVDAGAGATYMTAIATLR